MLMIHLQAPIPEAPTLFYILKNGVGTKLETREYAAEGML